MVQIKNLKIYELTESINACRNAMRTDLPDHYSDEEFNRSLARAKSLCKTPSNSGEANFLTGIRVAFDIIYPNYFYSFVFLVYFMPILPPRHPKTMFKLMSMFFQLLLL